MKIEIPDFVGTTANILFELGYKYCEAYPWERWQERKWPNDKMFIMAVDAVLKLMWTIKNAGPEKNWETETNAQVFRLSSSLL